MPTFIDTNIAIGYSVIHDKWHIPSKEFIETNSENIFWSELVENEYTYKLNEVINLTEMFLETTNHILLINQNDFISYDSFEKFVLKKTRNCKLDTYKKIRILENFWGKYNFREGSAQILPIKFSKFKESFKKAYIKQDNKLYGRMTLNKCGLNNYKKYLIYAQFLGSNGIHNPDCKIITDAHDCGLKHENLIFVSNDKILINQINELEVSFPTIMGFKSLN